MGAWSKIHPPLSSVGILILSIKAWSPFDLIIEHNVTPIRRNYITDQPLLKGGKHAAVGICRDFIVDNI